MNKKELKDMEVLNLNKCNDLLKKKIKKIYNFIMVVFIILFSVFIGLYVVGNVALSKEYMYFSCCHGIPCHGIYYSNKDNLCHFIECERDNSTFRSFGYGSNCTFIPTNLTAI